MIRAIERFINRLDLPECINFKLKNCWENYNPEYLSKFEKLKKNNYTLELIHFSELIYDVSRMRNIIISHY